MRIMMLAASLGAAALLAAPASGATFTNPAGGLSADETTWHVRAALNVAALACRDADAAQTAAAYNAMLDQERVPLAHAAAAGEAGYRARYGADWQARDDGDMTRLYNFFAAPPGQDAFCVIAKAVLRDAAKVEPSDFAAFAAEALPALERPFAPRVPMAAAAPVQIAVVAPVAIVPPAAEPAPSAVVLAEQLPLAATEPHEVMIATVAPVPLAPGH